jgi:two-component system sensor histidine kinase YesM
VVVGSFFYQYSSNIFEKNTYNNLSVVSDKMSQQLDKLVYSMEFISINLISDKDFKESLTLLSNVNRKNKSDQNYVNDSMKNVKDLITNYSINKNFYRVSVFNLNGDYFTSNFDTDYNNTDKIIKELNWTDKCDKNLGKILLVPLYKDPWSKKEKEDIFSLVRSIRGYGGTIAYMEVQNRYSELETIFNIPDTDGVKVISFTDSGDVFYKSTEIDDDLVNYYKNYLFDDNMISTLKKENPLTYEKEILIKNLSTYTGIKFLIIQNRDFLLKPLTFAGNIAILISVLIFIISFIYIYIIARHISKPIQQLTNQMEITELSNLPEKVRYKKTNNEIEKLNMSFENLKERLNESVNREIKSHSLQMKANFDSLQAQVNPHFIYNILNLLSNRGVVNNDYEICEICDSIATMLRYSTSTKETTASVKEEINHVKNYLSLMKKRYEHKLDYNIEISESIYYQIIPKIVLQQIVENSINHGYKGEILKINIKGYKSNDWWYIDIIDNGKGFDIEKLQNFEMEINNLSKDLSDIKSGFSINGMGILNTYARLMLFYNNIFVFKIKNLDSNGVKVTIGSKFIINLL